MDIFARAGAPVIAVNDGRVVRVGRCDRAGRFIRLRDVFGNTYTYAQLGRADGAHQLVRQGSRVRAGAVLARPSAATREPARPPISRSSAC